MTGKQIFFTYMLQIFHRLESLEKLSLMNFKLYRSQMELIGQLTSLKTLILGCCNFRYVYDLEPILNLVNLEELNIGICRSNIDDLLVNFVDNLKSLTSFTMCDPNVRYWCFSTDEFEKTEASCYR